MYKRQVHIQIAIGRKMIVKNPESNERQYKTVIKKGIEHSYLTMIKKKKIISRKVDKAVIKKKNSTKGMNEGRSSVDSRTQYKQNSEIRNLIINRRRTKNGKSVPNNIISRFYISSIIQSVTVLISSKVRPREHRMAGRMKLKKPVRNHECLGKKGRAVKND